MFHSMRLPPWWQVRQAWLRISYEVFEFFENVMSGLAREPPAAGFFMCTSLSPWQLVQVGVRLSARVPCFVLPMRRPPPSFSAGQAVHLASPFSPLSTGLSCATAPPAMRAITKATENNLLIWPP